MFGSHGHGAQGVNNGNVPVKVNNGTSMLHVVVTVLPGVLVQPEMEGCLPELLNQSMHPNTCRLPASIIMKSVSWMVSQVLARLPSRKQRHPITRCAS